MYRHFQFYNKNYTQQNRIKMIAFPNLKFSIYHAIVAITALCMVSYSANENSEIKAYTEFQFSVSNPLDIARQNQLVEIPLPTIMASLDDFNPEGFVILIDDNKLPSEITAENNLVFILPEIGPNATQPISILYDAEGAMERDYPKLTQAELSVKEGGYFEANKYIGGDFVKVSSLRVPDEHTDHSFYIRYEGPGWESDKVGYRFYLDWRNGIDVFGKKVSEPILQKVGLDGFDSYHEMQDWGMDILKVGSSLGLGSIATLIDGKARRVDETDSLYSEIQFDGSVYSAIKTNYHGWNLPDGKVDVESVISIHAGTRLSKNSLSFSRPIGNVATGLIIDPKAEPIKSGSNLKYSYLATYGAQSLAGDSLGIAIFFPTGQLIESTKDEFSHVVSFGPDITAFDYYFAAAWEQEKDGITNKEEFIAYLEQVIRELSNPLNINF